MLCALKSVCSIIVRPAFCSFNNIYVSACNQKEKWDLCSSVCLEREPVIAPDLTELEFQFSQLLEKLEFVYSMKSEHEIRLEMERKQTELIKSGQLEDINVDTFAQKTAQDFEDASQEEREKFQPAQRIREADKQKNTRSLDRKLSERLLYLSELKIGGKNTWVLPFSTRNDGETMRQTAERVLKEMCGNNLHVSFLGNAPCGVYKYKYPASVNNNSVGAKIFFFKARYLKGQIDAPKNAVNDFQWLCKTELSNILHPDYYHSVSQFLV